MALTPDEITLIGRMKQDLDSRALKDELMSRYNDGLQRVEQLGMAVPPSMRRFLVIANWCQVLTDTIEGRQNVRSLILPGKAAEEPSLRAIWDANNLDADLSLFNLDRLIYGRAFMSVGANEDDRKLPLMHVESPREVAAIVNVRQRRLDAACRFYGVDTVTGNGPTDITLYLPEQTVWVTKEQPSGRWVEVDRDPHRLGVVPMVMHLNRRRSGPYVGRSELASIIPYVDAAARSLTNMQFGQEAHGIPRMIATGVAKGDFVDADGNPIPKWKAYFDAIWMNESKDAKVTQLTASDLKNFETSISLYARLAAVQSRFPARYFGLHTTNPPAEGAIRADEAQLVELVERQNAAVGTTIGWGVALANRIATGDWVTGNKIRVDWFDPGTPTYSQRADAIGKLTAGPVPILSREGAWDELGWSEARKARERERFATQPATVPASAPQTTPPARGQAGSSAMEEA